MLEWTVEEKVLLNSRQVIVDGWRMNNQQLCKCLEKLLNNQDKVLPGRLGKGFLDILEQIAAGKTKARWSDMMKDIDKLQEIIQEHREWEEESWFEFLQELEVQQDRYFKTQLGAFFVETLKYKLNLMEEPAGKQGQIEDDQEILPRFLREEDSPIEQLPENDIPVQDHKTDADMEKASRKPYFRKKSVKSHSKKNYFKKKTEQMTFDLEASEQDFEKAVEQAASELQSDIFENSDMSDIMEWDPFSSGKDLYEKTEPIAKQEVSEQSGWNLSGEKKPADDIDEWDLFPETGQSDMLENEQTISEMDSWDIFEEQQAISKMDSWDPFEEQQTVAEMDQWDPFKEQPERSAAMENWDTLDVQQAVSKTDEWGVYENPQGEPEWNSWNQWEEKRTDAETEVQEAVDVRKTAFDEQTAGTENRNSGQLQLETDEPASIENKEKTKFRAPSKNGRQRLNISKVLKRTAIAIFACLSLCIVVFWLRDQIARNIDKWNLGQIKIGSFGRTGEGQEPDTELLSDGKEEEKQSFGMKLLSDDRTL